MRFNKSNLKTIRADVAAALAAVESKHDVKFSLGNIRFSDNDFRCKLECFSAATGNSTDIDRQKFESKCWMFDVPKSSFGKTFKSGRKTYTITGLNTRAHKYPIQATDSRGNRYKFPVSMLPTNLRSK
jgi:hypothetical protein